MGDKISKLWSCQGIQDKGVVPKKKRLVDGKIERESSGKFASAKKRKKKKKKTTLHGVCV